MPSDQDADHDGAWKTALQTYLPQCLALLWPSVHARLDWRSPPVFLDRELQRLARGADTGRRTVDVLARLRGKDGHPAWVMVHIEVQDRVRADFTRRMYRYHARLKDRYADADVTSLAVVLRGRARGHRTLSPSTLVPVRLLTFHEAGAECELLFRFPAVYIEDWRVHQSTLEATARSNPFALVLLAQLQATAGPADQARYVRKTALLRLMYTYRYARDDVLAVFNLLDWLLVLPPVLEQAFLEDVVRIEAEQAMPYVTSVERLAQERGMARGLAEGLEQGLEQGREQGIAHGQRVLRTILRRQLGRRFGALPDWAEARLESASESALTVWADRVLDVSSLAEVFDAPGTTKPVNPEDSGR